MYCTELNHEMRIFFCDYETAVSLAYTCTQRVFSASSELERRVTVNPSVAAENLVEMLAPAYSESSCLSNTQLQLLQLRAAAIYS